MWVLALVVESEVTTGQVLLRGSKGWSLGRRSRGGGQGTSKPEKEQN